MSKNRQWRIFYADGSTYSDLDGPPFDAPATGVQVIAKTDANVGRILLSCCDYYWWDNKRGTWFSGDVAGFFQHLMMERGPKAVLFGQYISNQEFHNCVVRALADPDFPTKSARHSSDGYLP